jgi:molybdate transport system regulatory protein
MTAPVLSVRFRIDFGGKCSLGIGKIELLEGIAGSGSLSQAARNMGMSYRRAWLLLADLNVSFDQPVAFTSTGGRGGGGVTLTPFGERLVVQYRKMEAKLKTLAEAHFMDFRERQAKQQSGPGAAKTLVPVASIRRKRGT